MHGCLRNLSNQSSHQSVNLQLYFRGQPVTKQRNTPKPRIGGFSLCLHIGSMLARRRMKEWMRACTHTPLILNLVFLCLLRVEEWPDPLKLWVCHGSVSFLLDCFSSYLFKTSFGILMSLPFFPPSLPPPLRPQSQGFLPSIKIEVASSFEQSNRLYQQSTF